MNNPELHKLVRAVKRADLSSIASLCQSGIDVNQLTQHGQTPLCIAAIKGNTDVIRVLIDAGADVNKASAIGFNPLTWAVWAKQRKAVALLRNLGAKHEKTNSIVEFEKAIYPEAEVAFLFWEEP